MNLDTKAVKREDIIAADMDGETVMLDIVTGKYYNLGAIGGVIWDLMDGEATIGEIIMTLLEKYDVDEAQCRAETLDFVGSMAEKGLVTVGP